MYIIGIEQKEVWGKRYVGTFHLIRSTIYIYIYI
jgi:hypothetical protein